LHIPVIASGGIGSMKDIKELCAVQEEGIAGAITGRAIYEGLLDFQKAQIEADKLSQKNSL
jgi:phosphoribosylformimino-5-aminoimidazole carboxamide ribotide isomerase